MKKTPRYNRYLTLLPIALAAQVLLAAPSTEPAQSPLLKRTASVRPNVIVMLDHSNSMETDIKVGWSNNKVQRWQAVAKALKDAITQDKYIDQFRLGYGVFKEERLVRGVRPFSGAARDEFLTWLTRTDKAPDEVDPKILHSYKASLGGGTSAHEAVLVAGEYYRGHPPNTTWYGDNTKNYPWPWSKKNDDQQYTSESIYTYKPWDTSLEDKTKLSCRSANLVMLTDGAWGGASEAEAYGMYEDYSPHALFQDKLYGSTPPAVSDREAYWNSSPGPEFTGIKNGKATKLSYNPLGDPDDRTLYIPYGDFGKTTSAFAADIDKKSNFGHKLSDLTAYYYWHTDLRPDLTNDVITGGPTFWQNMKTYTINFQVPLERLSFEQIANYETTYLLGGDFKSAMPKWSMGFNGESDEDLQSREDDTIQAGFTGGGRGYSPSTAEELEKVFDTILDDAIFGGRGNDAGVAVSGAPVYDDAGLEGRTKYLVEYDAVKNEGDLLAYELKKDGDYAKIDNGVPVPKWSAADRLPPPGSRTLYLLDPSGTRHTMTTKTELKSDSVGSGNYAAINGTGRFPDDKTFAKYMLGVLGQKNRNSTDLLRPLPKISAMVNAPALFVRYGNGMQYAKTKNRTFSQVEGNLKYNGYFKKKYESNMLIYAPANSGMIHAFNGKSGLSMGGSAVQEGAEMAAYLPNSIMPKLDKFSRRDYTFEYLTDGPLIEQDIYDSSAEKWRQILFGTGGRGGQFVYALESRMESGGVRKPAASDFLWEKSKNTKSGGSPSHPNMAYMTNAVTAGQLLDGRWVALVNSGHYPAVDKNDSSKKQKVGLYVLNALTGATIRFIPLPAGQQADNRGLGGVTAVRDIGRRIVAAYAGDAKGNLWRFDLRPSQMNVSYNKPLFTAPAGQPIYAAPAWQRHPGGVLPNEKSCVAGTKRDDAAQCGTIIAIGTGILLDDKDILDGGKQGYQQALYGIWDPTPVVIEDNGKSIDVEKFTTVPVSSLLEQTMKSTTVGNSSKAYLQTSDNPVNYKDKGKKRHRGWRLNLDALGDTTDGERVIASAKNVASSFFFSTVVVNNRKGPESCTAIRNFPNLLYGLNALSGGATKAFDSDGDGKRNDVSVLFVQDGGFTRGNKVLVKGETGFDKLVDTYTGPDTEDCIMCNPCDTSSEKELEAQIQAVGGKEKYFALCPPSGPIEWKRSWRQILSIPK